MVNGGRIVMSKRLCKVIVIVMRGVVMRRVAMMRGVVVVKKMARRESEL